MATLTAVFLVFAVIFARIPGNKAARYKANIVEAPSNYGYQQQVK